MNIPKWFNIANYNCAINWTAKEWAHAVFTRDLVSGTLNSPHFIADHVEALIDAFNIDRSSVSAGTVEAWNAIMKEMHLKPEGIEDETYYDIRAEIQGAGRVTLGYLGWLNAEMAEGLSESEVDYLTGHPMKAPSSEYLKLGQTTVEDRYIELGDHPSTFCNSLIATIDLEMPDEILMQHIAKLIHEAREQYGIKPLNKSPSQADFRRWCDAMVLGYYDLMLLSKINGVTLTNQQIGARLFPKEFDVSLADRIRKVTKPLSAEVFSGPMFMALDLVNNAEDFSRKIAPE